MFLEKVMCQGAKFGWYTEAYASIFIVKYNTMAKFYAKYLLGYIQVEETPLIMAVNNPGIKFPL